MNRAWGLDISRRIREKNRNDWVFIWKYDLLAYFSFKFRSFFCFSVSYSVLMFFIRVFLFDSVEFRKVGRADCDVASGVAAAAAVADLDVGVAEWKRKTPSKSSQRWIEKSISYCGSNLTNFIFLSYPMNAFYRPCKDSIDRCRTFLWINMSFRHTFCYMIMIWFLRCYYY